MPIAGRIASAFSWRQGNRWSKEKRSEVVLQLVLSRDYNGDRRDVSFPLSFSVLAKKANQSRLETEHLEVQPKVAVMAGLKQKMAAAGCQHIPYIIPHTFPVYAIPLCESAVLQASPLQATFGWFYAFASNDDYCFPRRSP